MLDIEIEPFRGILFVRLSGYLNRQNINKLNKEVIKLVKKIGIKNIVFNLENVKEIDKYGENVLIKSFNICLSNKGQMFICTSNKEKLTQKLNKLKIIKDELTAVNIINS